jgi:hypothetical protein
LERLKLDNPAFHNAFVNGHPLRSTLSAPEQEFNALMLEYVTTPKKKRANVVDRLLDTQWVLSQDIPGLTEDPLAEARERLMNH